LTFARTRDFALVKSTQMHPTQMRMASDDATDCASFFDRVSLGIPAKV